jgi:hypothetical protein
MKDFKIEKATNIETSSTKNSNSSISHNKRARLIQDNHGHTSLNFNYENMSSISDESNEDEYIDIDDSQTNQINSVTSVNINATNSNLRNNNTETNSNLNVDL